MCRAFSRAIAEDGVYPIPEDAIDDRLVLSGIGRALVHCIADVDPIVDHAGL